MRKSRIFILVMMLLFVIPLFVKAEQVNGFDESTAILVGQTNKYLKTVNEYDNVELDSYGNIVSADLLSSVTYELTKEEWDNINLNDNRSTRATTTIETTYKLMTTSLYYSNGYYRYQNQLNWLNFPSVRAYDVIGIGHYSNITPNTTPTFYLDYTTSAGTHYINYLSTQQSFSTGKSATFSLPTQSLQSMGAVFYFDARKVNPSNTIYSQAINHDVNGSLGIVHDSSVYNKFDTINEAAVYWNGTW